MVLRRTASILIVFALFGCAHPEHRDTAAALARKQAQVVERGRTVMPFDIHRSMHHFKALPTGGLQQVLSTDGDPRQIALIREHLRAEAIRFQRGDFSDPSRIHGPEMPGLNALAAGARRIRVEYSDLPAGGQITYSTADPKLVEALHAWFDAQVREHGGHAMPG